MPSLEGYQRLMSDSFKLSQDETTASPPPFRRVSHASGRPPSPDDITSQDVFRMSDQTTSDDDKPKRRESKKFVLSSDHLARDDATITMSDDDDEEGRYIAVRQNEGLSMFF